MVTCRAFRRLSGPVHTAPGGFSPCTLRGPAAISASSRAGKPVFGGPLSGGIIQRMSAPEPRPVQSESFIEEMKRYLHLLPEDATFLRELGPRMEKYLPEMAEKFYAQIPHHPGASRVFIGGEAQVQRLKSTLQAWGRGLFNGVYGEHYAEAPFRIGFPP